MDWVFVIPNSFTIDVCKIIKVPWKLLKWIIICIAHHASFNISLHMFSRVLSLFFFHSKGCQVVSPIRHSSQSSEENGRSGTGKPWASWGSCYTSCRDGKVNCVSGKFGGCSESAKLWMSRLHLNFKCFGTSPLRTHFSDTALLSFRDFFRYVPIMSRLQNNDYL